MAPSNVVALRTARRAGKICRLWNTCPQTDDVSGYDRDNFTLYALLLEAETEGAHTRDMASTFFEIDWHKDSARAERVVHSHLRRAHWLVENGYAFLVW